MRSLWMSLFGLWVIGMGIAISAPALAANAVGPYYATPSWDQTFPAATRFIVLTNMNSQAVLDRETGLVWEQSPGIASFNWADASGVCTESKVGGRLGWRLPTIHELASLWDPAVGSGVRLPPGHPFSNVQAAQYWSATTSAIDDSLAHAGDFGNFFGPTPAFNKSFTLLAWCVRG